MKKGIGILLVFASQLFPVSAFAQYVGGDADGFAVSTLIQLVCSSLENTNVFVGGNADGFATNRLNQSVCASLENTNVFVGGNADGFAINKLNQAVCAPLENTDVSFGGNADGFAINKLNQAVCAPLENINVFFGGNAEGGAVNELAQSICPAVLPIELQSWQALCDQKKATLRWTTSSEINNDYFSIQRSNDAINWSTINSVAGAGNSNQPRHYSYKDVGNVDETVYYRLIQTDYDGRFEYSEIISVDCGNDDLSNIVVAPNPNTGKFVITGLNPETRNKITIYDCLGELVWESDFCKNSIGIDFNDKSKGVYIVHVYSEMESSVHKIIVE